VLTTVVPRIEAEGLSMTRRLRGNEGRERFVPGNKSLPSLISPGYMWTGKFVHDTTPLKKGWELMSPNTVRRDSCCPVPAWDSGGNPVDFPPTGPPANNPPTAFGPYLPQPFGERPPQA